MFLGILRGRFLFKQVGCAALQAFGVYRVVKRVYHDSDDSEFKSDFFSSLPPLCPRAPPEQKFRGAPQLKSLVKVIVVRADVSTEVMVDQNKRKEGQLSKRAQTVPVVTKKVEIDCHSPEITALR